MDFSVNEFIFTASPAVPSVAPWLHQTYASESPCAGLGLGQPLTIQRCMGVLKRVAQCPALHNTHSSICPPLSPVSCPPLTFGSTEPTSIFHRHTVYTTVYTAGVHRLLLAALSGMRRCTPLDLASHSRRERGVATQKTGLMLPLPVTCRPGSFQEQSQLKEKLQAKMQRHQRHQSPTMQPTKPTPFYLLHFLCTFHPKRQDLCILLLPLH